MLFLKLVHCELKNRSNFNVNLICTATIAINYYLLNDCLTLILQQRGTDILEEY